MMMLMMAKIGRKRVWQHMLKERNRYRNIKPTRNRANEV
jgi:hypothetical protein